MRIWNAYGSEHSANLVMIGTFKDAGGPQKAQEAIQKIIAQINTDVEAGLLQSGEGDERFTPGMMEVLKGLGSYSFGALELTQFEFEAHQKIVDNKLVITTDEYDVSAFLKLMIDMGARVEVYSAHDHPDTPYGRGK